MRVWTKPELIVDTMELSQRFAAGCDILSTNTTAYPYVFRRAKGANPGHPDDYKDYNYQTLQSMDQYDPIGSISKDEVEKYYKDHGGHSDYILFSGQTGKLQDS